MFLLTKCSYGSLDAKCDACAEKGLPCGPKVKAKTRTTPATERAIENTQIDPNSGADIIDIARSLPTVGKNRVTEFEAKHLQALRQGQWLFGFTNLQRFRTDSHRLWHNVFRRFDPNISARSVRSACILYSLYHHGEMVANGEPEIDRYLHEFYKAAQRAIGQQDYAELVYGCFATCMYSIRTKRSFDEILHHADGFRLSVMGFVAVDVVDIEEKFLLECMWEKVVWYIVRLVTNLLAPQVDLYPRLEGYCHPLSLGNYIEWMENAYCEIKAKLDFAKVLLRIAQVAKGELDPDRMIQSLAARFYKAMLMSPTGRPIRWSGTQDLFTSSTIAKFWSLLCGLVGSMLQNDGAESTSRAVFSVLDVINLMESRQAEVVEISLFTLILTGLIVKNNKDLYVQFGFRVSGVVNS